MPESYIFWAYLVGLLIGGLSGYKIGKYGVLIKTPERGGGIIIQYDDFEKVVEWYKGLTPEADA